MVYCKNCGTKNEDNVKFCQNCGKPFKTEEKKMNLGKINLKAILYGGITYLIVLVLELTLFNIILGGRINGILTPSTYLMGNALFMVVVGAITGYISGRTFSSGAINTVIIAIFYAIIAAILVGNFYIFVVMLIAYALLGVIGSVIGVLIYRLFNRNSGHN